MGNNAGALDAAVASDAPWSAGAATNNAAKNGMWSANGDVPMNVLVVLRQLANLYVLFGVLEVFVLRAASSQRMRLPLPAILARGKRVGSPEKAAIARSGAHGASERVLRVLRGVLGFEEGTVYDLRVWRAFLGGLLLADLGHLVSLARLGWGGLLEGLGVEWDGYWECGDRVCGCGFEVGVFGGFGGEWVSCRWDLMGCARAWSEDLRESGNVKDGGVLRMGSYPHKRSMSGGVGYGPLFEDVAI